MPGSNIPWMTGVLADGPFAGAQVNCENRIGARVHFKTDITYEVTALAEGNQPASLTQVAEPGAADPG